MNKIFSIFLLFSIGFAPIVNAQSNDYYTIKEVNKYRFDKLELHNDKDIEEFLNHADKYNFIASLKICNTNKLASIIQKLNTFYDFSELNLLNYTGDFSASIFDSCKQIEKLHIKVNENKLAQIEATNSLSKLNCLYLYINGKVENTADFKFIPNIKEVHIIGDFLPLELQKTIVLLKPKINIQTLGLSVDRITDLPKDLSKLYYLSTLILYDNLSLATTESIEELNTYTTAIKFNIDFDLQSIVQVKYLATSAMSNYELNYIEKLYKGEIFGDKLENNETNNADSILAFRKAFSPDYLPTSEFNFLTSTLKPKEEIFAIDANENSTIISETGLKLSIAKNSFTTINGELINGMVYIKIMQIPRAIDALFCGFNFKLGSNYLANHFLYNIQASTATSEAILKPGMQIKTLMPLAKDSTCLEYYFDYESNSWQDLTLYNSVFSNEFTPIDFYKLDKSSDTKKSYLFDSTSFNNRLYYAENFFLNDKNINTQIVFNTNKFFTDLDRPWTKAYNQDGKKNGARIKRGKGLIKIQKVTPKNRNTTCQYFKVVDKTEKKILAELDAFKSINFNVKINSENKKELTEKYITNKKYSDVRITYLQGKQSCKILLKVDNGLQELEAFITDSDEQKVIKKQVAKFYKAYKKYTLILEKRAKSFDKNNEERNAEYEKYLTDKIEILEKNKQQSEIKIHQLGTFGLVKLQQHEFNTNLIVNYTDERGVPIDIKTIFMLDERYATPIKLDKENIAINPATFQLIVATDYNGNLFYANKSNIAGMNFSNNSYTYIKLNLVKTKLTSIEAFLNYCRN